MKYYKPTKKPKVKVKVKKSPNVGKLTLDEATRLEMIYLLEDKPQIDWPCGVPRKY